MEAYNLFYKQFCLGAVKKHDNVRRVRALEGVARLRLKVRQCATPECERFCQPYCPEAGEKWALPQHEFGLDVIALVGAYATKSIGV